jgi:hypothetical protein
VSQAELDSTLENVAEVPEQLCAVRKRRDRPDHRALSMLVLGAVLVAARGFRPAKSRAIFVW